MSTGGCVTGSDLQAITTSRLLVRPPREADRGRFVELFCDEDFMVFYPGALTVREANDRFDHMVAVCQAVPFGKQPVVVSLRTPYDLRAFPQIETYLCAYSYRPVSTEAAARVLFGEIEARGVLPCTIPGASTETVGA